ncbi:MAG: CPBP family intramembrane metalloprotease [Candidatus Lokiarchaeota archaeon]|nr:CPBP family intramembrane metalloprotease [Candidatus Lokiarchaeota archaeon]
MSRNRKKEIARDRLRFFIYEVALGFILIIICILIPLFLIPLLVGEGSLLYGILLYSLRAIFVFIGIPLMLIISNLVFESQKRKIIIKEDISSAKGHLKLYKMTNKNYKYQILYGLLIFFLVFLPIDFFGYLLIPDMLEYQASALPDTDIYLTSATPYILFLISVIIIQFSVAVTEETISRGLITKRGSEYFFRMSAVMISALYWGFGHFAYFLNPIPGFSIWYPFIWFLQAFVIGIVLSLFLLRKKWIFPVIIAHTLNNIVSAHAVWSLNNAIDFSVVALYLYLPLLIIGCVLFIWQFSQIKESLSIGFKMLKSYFKRDNASEDTKGDIIFRVFFDIIMALIIFLMGFMIMI